MKSLIDMNHIHDNEVNNIYECNLLHAILNTSRSTKNISIYDYTFLHGCMNTCTGRAKFKDFGILMDSGCIYTIMTRRLTKN